MLSNNYLECSIIFSENITFQGEFKNNNTPLSHQIKTNSHQTILMLRSILGGYIKKAVCYRMGI